MKVLISSDCNGQFKTLFGKVSQLLTKNKFDCLILVGSVCTLQSSALIPFIKSQEIKIQIPTFFIDNNQIGGILSSTNPIGLQITPNFQFLGAYGVKRILSTNIAFLNGVQLKEQMQLQSDRVNKYLGRYYTSQTIRKLINQCEKYERIDILLTNEWAYEYSDKIQSRSYLISQLVEKVCPKYHIAGSGGYFQRMEPFKSIKGTPTHFINVAPILNQNPTGKYLYGINVTNVDEVVKMNESPFKKMRNNQQANIEKKIIQNEDLVHKSKQRNEILDMKKYQNTKIDQDTQIYFQGFKIDARDYQITQFIQKWGDIATIQIFPPKKNKKFGFVRFRDSQSAQICLKDSQKYSYLGQRIKFEIRSKNNHLQNQQCWFCISSKHFDNSLVIYKGKTLYIAIDKGPINQTHIQLVPYTHQSNRKHLTKQQIEQLEIVKNNLKRYYENINKTFISYLRYANLSDNINHYVQHCLAVGQKEVNLIKKFNQINLRDNLGFKIMKLQNYNNNVYFAKIQIGSVKYYKQLRHKQRKDILRQNVCILLDQIDSINWKDCEIKGDRLNLNINALRQIINSIVSV